MTSGMSIFAWDDCIEGVGETNTQGIEELAVGEHILGLVDGWVGKSVVGLDCVGFNEIPRICNWRGEGRTSSYDSL